MPTPYPHGTFCWIDLSARDAKTAKQFYSELFELQIQDNHMGDDEVYTMLLRDELPLAGLYQQSDDQIQEQMPSHWLAYLAVDDLDASAKLSKELGGEVLVEPFEILGVGRMAVIRDPGSCMVALWQRDSPHRGAAMPNNRPGRFNWMELAARRPAATIEFYTELMGWSATTQEFHPGMPYTLFHAGEIPVAGLYPLKKAQLKLPAGWMVYFGVENCDAAITKAEQLGAKLLRPTLEIANVGHFATFKDPQGALFSLLEPFCAN